MSKKLIYVLIAAALLFGLPRIYTAVNMTKHDKRIARLSNDVYSTTPLLNRYASLKSNPDKSIAEIDEMQEIRKRIDEMLKDYPEIKQQWDSLK